MISKAEMAYEIKQAKKEMEDARLEFHDALIEKYANETSKS